MTSCHARKTFIFIHNEGNHVLSIPRMFQAISANSFFFINNIFHSELGAALKKHLNDKTMAMVVYNHVISKLGYSNSLHHGLPNCLLDETVQSAQACDEDIEILEKKKITYLVSIDHSNGGPRHELP